MFLLFLTPVQDENNLFFGCVPARSIVHFALFWGFVHIWIGTCKKQLKNEMIRRKAFLITFIAAVGLALISETVMYLFGISDSFSFWNLGFDLLGSCLGIITFRLLYASCY